MNVKDLFAAIDTQDVEKFLSFLDDEVHFVFGNMPTMEGKSQVELGVTQFFSAIKSLSHTVEKQYHDKDNIIIRGSVTYTRENDTELTVPFCNILELKNDKIKTYLIYVDVSGLF